MTNHDARLLVDSTISNFKVSETLMREFFPAAEGDRDSCYLFSFFATTGMLYFAIKAGYDVKEEFQKLIDGFAYYRSQPLPDGTVKYHSERGSQPDGGNGPCFFDDNIWTARNYLFAYEIFGDEKYLREAQRIVSYVYTGWNNELGGLVWNENGLTDSATVQELERGLSANACASLVNSILYQLTGQKPYLAWAEKFYNFCKQTQDPDSKIYYNGLHTLIENGVRKCGAVNKDLYSYNSGSMILADLKLYEITGDRSYLEDAKQSSQAAYKAFIKTNPENNEPYAKDFIWFAAVLVESWQALCDAGETQEKEYLKIIGNSIEYSFRFKSEFGLLPHDTVCGWRSNDVYDRLLLTHCAIAEIAVISQANAYSVSSK